jgi:anti-sigma factor RsiW
MLNCQEFKHRLINYSEEENVSQQAAEHIQVCQTCRALYLKDKALDSILEKGMQSVDPPEGLITRARARIESESPSQRFKFPKGSWKTVVPALSMAALVIVMLLNPFSAPLQTVDEVVTHSIANHLDTGMKMVFRTEEVADVGQWFTRRLGYAVRLPDLKKMGLEVVGGRECALGKINAALLFCNSKGKRASLFVINQNDVGLRFEKERKYIVEEGGLKVTLWKEFGTVYAMVI